VTRLRKRELRRKLIQPELQKIGINGRGLAHLRHTWARCLRIWENTNSQSATIYGHANLHVTNKYLQATSKTKRHAQTIGRCDPGCGLLAETEPGAIAALTARSGREVAFAAFRPLISPDPLGAGL